MIDVATFASQCVSCQRAIVIGDAIAKGNVFNELNRDQRLSLHADCAELSLNSPVTYAILGWVQSTHGDTKCCECRRKLPVGSILYNIIKINEYDSDRSRYLAHSCYNCHEKRTAARV